MNRFEINKTDDLLLRLRDGDEIAFELIFYRLKGKIFDFVRRSLTQDNETENIVQDVFLKLWLYRAQIDPEKSLDSLLYTIARNKVFGHLRKVVVRRKYIEEVASMLNGSDETTEKQIEYNELQIMVAKLVKDMPIYIESPNIKVNRQQNNFDEKDFQYAYVPVGEELFELLIDLNLENNQDSNEYIIAPEVENRENIEKYASRYFTFFFKKLKRDYTRQLKHLRQTYITREDLFVNGRISMQHSNYRTTSKHYIDKREIAKQMVKNGFRIFEK